jgi:hypothetical protein
MSLNFTTGKLNPKNWLTTNCAFLLVLFSNLLGAQYGPGPGVAGTSAIPAESTLFIAWASGCEVSRGLKDISQPDSGYASAGNSAAALGPAKLNATVSLGDVGQATLTFDRPIRNGAGPDFAVFENGFAANDKYFLELAFVEVSSDGRNFFRFPANSLTDTSQQVAPFGLMDPTKINNLAGKYPFGFGTPFDLEELRGTPGLDLEKITHVRVIDVVGCMDPKYATRDALGNKINDPWPTLFPSGGFDLDAVGVINQQMATGLNDLSVSDLKMYPNPAQEILHLENGNSNGQLVSSIQIVDVLGKIRWQNGQLNLPIAIPLEDLENGLYFVQINQSVILPLLIQKR